jgi:hypothetical protein
VTSCVIWLVGYGLVWYFFMRPPKGAEWLNAAVVATILLCTLPPARVRPIVAGVSLLALAAAFFLTVPGSPLIAIVLGLSGLFALSDALFDLRGRRSKPPA